MRTIQLRPGFFLIYFVCLLLGPLQYAVGAEALSRDLDQKVRQVDLSDIAYQLEDPEGTLTFDDVKGEAFAAKFHIASTKSGFSPSAFWWRFSLNNLSDQPLNLLFDTGSRILREADFYVQQDGSDVYMQFASAAQTFTQRPLPTATYVFPLTLKAHASGVVYLRVRSYAHTVVAITPKIVEPAVHASNAHREEANWTAYLGLSIGLLAFNLFVYFFTKDRNYLLYILSTAALVWSVSSTAGGYGFAYEYFWPESPRFEQISSATSFLVAVLCITIFSAKFLNYEVTLPTLHRYLKVCGLLMLVIWGFRIGVDYFQLNSLRNILPTTYFVSMAITILLAVPLFAGAAKLAWDGDRSARVIVIAWAPAFVGLVYSGFASLSGKTTITEILIFGNTFEQIVMSAALADRFTQERKARARAQAQLGEEHANLEATVRDRTFQLREANTELAEQKQIAESATLSKSHFLAAASHDLRQPMHALNLYLGALAGHKLPEVVGPLLVNARHCAKIMDSMFRELLDISRLDAGILPAAFDSIPIAPLLNRIRMEYAPQAQAKGLSLRVVPCSAWVYSDPFLLDRILRNLVSNALRYTHHGKILIGCRRTAAGLRLAVYDTGVGIAPEQQGRVFDEFFQVGRADGDRDRAQGLGLGLAIVQRLAHTLKTQVTLVSELGRGSVFMVELARTEAVTGPLKMHLASSPVLPQGLHGVMVVVIDDEPIILDAMRALLEHWGCTVIADVSASAVITHLAAADNVPDVIISDFHLLNGETGIEAIQALRNEFNSDIPAMLITGETSPEHIRKTQQSGLKVLHKPLNDEALRSALTDLMILQP